MNQSKIRTQSRWKEFLDFLGLILLSASVVLFAITCFTVLIAIQTW